MLSQNDTNQETVKVNKKQLRTLAKICLLIQDLFNEANAAQLGPKFGTSKQNLQFYINQLRAEGEAKKNDK
jgi:hypothetical protein